MNEATETFKETKMSDTSLWGLYRNMYLLIVYPKMKYSGISVIKSYCCIGNEATIGILLKIL